MKKYNFKSVSEYLRAATEFFNARRYNAIKNQEIVVIQDCISLLETHMKNLQNELLTASLKDLSESLETKNEKKDKTFKRNSESLEENLEGNDNTSFKKSDEILERKNVQKNKRISTTFEEAIKTLIRITHIKGKPTDADFKFQANRCGKTKKEIIDYYDENYQFFIEEADKIL